MKLRNLLLIIIMLTVTSCASEYKPLVAAPEFPPPPRKIENVRVALVLGGGGAKGIAHLGVLSVLEENEIPIDLIVGTSAGSIIGSMYANYADAQLLYENIIHIKKWDLIDLSFSEGLLFFSELKGPVQGYYLQEFMVKNLTVNNLEELQIPFVAVATDLTTGKAYPFSSGPIAIAINASSAIPPMFSPVRIYGKIFVDGGVIEPVPVSTAMKYNPDIIIAVDIATPGGDYQLRNMLDVTGKSLSVAYYELSQMQSRKADIIIHPDLEGIGTFDDNENDKIFQIGRNATLKKLPEILMKLRKKKIIN